MVWQPLLVSILRSVRGWTRISGRRPRQSRPGCSATGGQSAKFAKNSPCDRSTTNCVGRKVACGTGLKGGQAAHIGFSCEGAKQDRESLLVRILAVADEVDEALYYERVRRLQPDLVVACGDLPFDYLEYLVTMLNVPLLFVPGNHDPDLRAKPETLGAEDFTRPFLLGSLRRERAGPLGCVNIDGRVVDAAGLRVAGLGGSIRYRQGPNQYSQRQMGARAVALELRIRRKGLWDRRPVDILATHSAPLGVGDGDDSTHRGFSSFLRLTARVRPKLLLHGHVHPYGRLTQRRQIGGTTVVNVVGRHMLDI